MTGADDLAALLDQAGTLLQEADAPPATRQGMAELRQRLAEGRLRLAVLGQFKRGKSTLLNALLGEPLLPSSVLPLTAVPTVILGAPSRGLRVTFADGRPPLLLDGPAVTTEAIARFVAEEANPENRLGVATVEISHPAPLLRGMAFVDTPGIGSTLRHNTRAALQALPRCDAALFVLSVDPPPTEAELAFLAEVRRWAPRVFFILNKTDQASSADLDRLLTFAWETLRREGGEGAAEIFPLSAREALAAREAGDAARLAASGLPALEVRLRDFLAGEAAAVLRAGIARKAVVLLDDEEARIALRLAALRRPVAEVEARLAAFDRAIGELEAQRRTAEDLLAGDLRRARALLEEQAATLRQRATAVLGAALDRALQEGATEQAAAEAVAAATRALFDAELPATVAAFDEALAGMMRPQQARLDALLAGVRQAAAESFAIPVPPGRDAGPAFEAAREPYWVTRVEPGSLQEVAAGGLEALLPGAWRQARRRRRLAAAVEALVVRNVENLRWATLQNIEASFRRFGHDLQARLAEAVGHTRAAVADGLAFRATREAGIAAEVARLEGVSRALRDIRDGLERQAAQEP